MVRYYKKKLKQIDKEFKDIVHYFTAGGVATAISQITKITDDAIGEKPEGGIDGNGSS